MGGMKEIMKRERRRNGEGGMAGGTERRTVEGREIWRDRDRDRDRDRVKERGKEREKNGKTIER